jgi:hypothetical protein
MILDSHRNDQTPSVSSAGLLCDYNHQPTQTTSNAVTNNEVYHRISANESPSSFQVTFYRILCLSSPTNESFFWYVDPFSVTWTVLVCQGVDMMTWCDDVLTCWFDVFCRCCSCSRLCCNDDSGWIKNGFFWICSRLLQDDTVHTSPPLASVVNNKQLLGKVEAADVFLTR